MEYRNIIRITITFSNKTKYAKQFELDSSQLTICDDLIQKIIAEQKLPEPSDVQQCSIELGVNNIAIFITNYTLTDTIYFSQFYDLPSKISILKSVDTNVHIVDLTIGLLQVDCKNIFIANCIVDEKFDIGIVKGFEGLNKRDESKQVSNIIEYIADTIELRNCKITEATLYVACDIMNIQASAITSLALWGGTGNRTPNINKLFVGIHSEIDICEIRCQIDKLFLKESQINSIWGSKRCLISKMEIADTIIKDANNFDKTNFATMSIEAWTLVSKSASKAKNANLKSEANYQIARSIYKSESGINKATSFFFDKCSGYGYKPLRVFASGGILIISAFMLFMISDLISLGKNAVANTLLNVANAFSALAGQSGLTLEDGAKFWIANVEYILGIVLFAVFANALYARYKD